MTNNIDDLSYRQSRCPHGWVERTQCESCATALEHDKALAKVEALQDENTELKRRDDLLSSAMDKLRVNTTTEIHGYIAERDSALARLAEIEALMACTTKVLQEMHDDDIKTINRLKGHIKHIGNDALRTENAELNARLAEIEKERDALLLAAKPALHAMYSATVGCEHFHHVENDRHLIGEHCTPWTRWEVARSALEDAIAKQVVAAAGASPVEPAYTYKSTQATTCAGCGEHKHTPLRIDAMDGYVCLTCIDRKLGTLLGEFGYPDPQPSQARELSRDDVRAAGGLVHSDGNIFFTSIDKLNAAINARGDVS